MPIDEKLVLDLPGGRSVVLDQADPDGNPASKCVKDKNGDQVRIIYDQGRDGRPPCYRLEVREPGLDEPALEAKSAYKPAFLELMAIFWPKDQEEGGAGD